MLEQLKAASANKKDQNEEPKIKELTEEERKQQAKEAHAKKQQKIQMQAVVEHYLKKNETQQQALQNILQFSGSKEARDMLVDTEVSKQLLRLVHQENCTQNVFKCLINLSQDEVFAKQLSELNASRRVFDFLVENVKPDMSSDTNKEIKLDRKENTYIIDDKSGEMSSTIQFAIMFLSNLTKVEEGCLNVLGKDKQEGAVLENLFGMFSYFERNQVFDFVANILSNVTSIKQARVFMIKSKMFERILDLLKTQGEKMNSHRRHHLIDTVRNTIFEYEAFEKEFIDMKVVDRFVKLLIEEQGMTDKRLPVRLHNIKAAKEKKPDQIDHYRTGQLVDGLVILSNLMTLQVRMVELDVEGLLKYIKIAAFGETPQKVEVLLIQLQQTRQENSHLQKLYDDEAKQAEEDRLKKEEEAAKLKAEEEAKKAQEESKEESKQKEPEVEFEIDTSKIKNVPLEKDEMGMDDVDRWLADQKDAFAAL